MPDTPIADTAVAVRIAPARNLSRRLIRGDPTSLGAAFGLALPTRPCTSAEGERTALWLGPDEWLVLASEDAAWPDWSGETGAVFNIGHRQVGFIVEGALAADTLAGASPLDLSPAHFPAGACTRTVFGKAEIVLWRPSLPRFHLETVRSFAAYVGELLQVCASDAMHLQRAD